MQWAVCKKASERDGVNEWALYLVSDNDNRENPTAAPFSKGYWFFGKDGGDPAGKRFYEEGWRNALAEVERLNRLGTPCGQQTLAAE